MIRDATKNDGGEFAWEVTNMTADMRRFWLLEIRDVIETRKLMHPTALETLGHKEE